MEKVDDELRALVADMFETMYAAPGIGLAAIQVGVPKRMLVIDLQEPEEEERRGGPATRACSSTPRSVEHRTRRCPTPKAACRCPTNMPRSMRPDRIRARWLDLDGKAHEEEIDGLLAVCLQHEMDHLEGMLFIDHLSRLKREMILKKLAKRRKEQGGA